MTMRRPPRPQPLAQSSVLNTTANPFASLLNEEDGLSEKRISAKDIGVSDDDYSSADESSPRGRQKPPRPSMAATSHRAALTASAKRRRRRSSARFLQLGGRRDGSMDGGVDGDESQNNTKTHSEGNLSELYQKAIRMNAENKINAVNSWNLRLIENIDKFLNMDEDETSPTTPIVNSSNMDASMSTKRVNFTKASCTLDASVKIYSYRVDDVHLTSYKVLANLNRTDTQKPVKATGSNEASAEEDDSPTQKRTISNKRIGSTLETQVGTYGMLG